MTRRLLLATLGALLVLLGGALLWTPARVLFTTGLLIPDLLPGFPFQPATITGRAVVREPVSFQLGDGTPREADVYRIPDGRERGAVLLFLGVNPAGRDDERVVNLATALARAGMVVMIPWSPAMTERRIDPDEADHLVHAFNHLRALPYVNAERVGLGGFCVGSSIAFISAADPRIRDDVSFVNFFGGYYDAYEFLAQVASHSRTFESKVEPWTPGVLTVAVFTSEVIETLPDAGERETLAAAFAPDGGGLDALPAGMSADARVAALLLSRPTLEEARRLVAALPAEGRHKIERVSPKTFVHDVRAPVLVMADVEDSLVPSTESRRLARDFEAQGGNTYLTMFTLFEHMDPTRQVSRMEYLREAGKLLQHLYRMLLFAQ